MEDFRPSGNSSYPLKMSAYFDADAKSYDAFTDLTGQYELYQKIADIIPFSEKCIDVFDFGIGTGYEVPFIISRLPNSRITGIDVSPKMIDRLDEKFSHLNGQVQGFVASIFDWTPGADSYDYIVASAIMHHFPPEVRSEIYRKIWKALRPGAFYIEADKFLKENEARLELIAYRERLNALGRKGVDVSPGALHIDVPSSTENACQLLFDAKLFPEVTFRKDPVAVIRARK